MAQGVEKGPLLQGGSPCAGPPPTPPSQGGESWPCVPTIVGFCDKIFSVSGLVLVLNQDFEPLNVCQTRRALALLSAGKAEIIANGRGYVSTPTLRLPRPSVIRLAREVHRPRLRLRLSRRAMFRRDGYRCQYCGRDSAHLTLDHIIPRSRGGKHSWTNLVSACAACNRRKGGKTLEEARMKLLSRPVEPGPSFVNIFGIYLQDNQEWIPFIPLKENRKPNLE